MFAPLVVVGGEGTGQDERKMFAIIQSSREGAKRFHVNYVTNNSLQNCSNYLTIVYKIVQTILQ